MMFAWWLIKRAWGWCKNNAETVCIAGLFGSPIFEVILNMLFGATADNGRTLWFPLTIAACSIFALFAIVASLLLPIIYLSNLHTQYRAEHPHAKTKRKHKRGDYRKARGCLADLFEDDPRSAEQIIRDYRDGHDASGDSFFEGYDTASEYVDNLGLDESESE